MSGPSQPPPKRGSPFAAPPAAGVADLHAPAAFSIWFFHVHADLRDVMALL